MRIVKIDRRLQGATSYRYTGAGSEVSRYVIAKLEAQDKEFPVGRCEGKTRRIQIDDCCAGRSESVNRGFEGIQDCLWGRLRW